MLALTPDTELLHTFGRFEQADGAELRLSKSHLVLSIKVADREALYALPIVDLLEAIERQTARHGD